MCLDSWRRRSRGRRQAWGIMRHGGHSSGISENGTRKGQNFTIKDTKRESRTNTKDKKLSQQCPRMTLTAMECIKLCANAPIDCVAHSERLENPTPDGWLSYHTTTPKHPNISLGAAVQRSKHAPKLGLHLRHGTGRIVLGVASCLFIKHQPRRYMYLRRTWPIRLHDNCIDWSVP